MDIYGSTQFIKEPKVGDMQLEVISQWDFMSKPVCFDTIYKGESNERVIPYKLCLITEVGENRRKYEDIDDPSDMVKRELVSMGYQVSDLVATDSQSQDEPLKSAQSTPTKNIQGKK